jgi:cell division protease FtsH
VGIPLGAGLGAAKAASDALLDAVDGEVRRIIEECYAEARETLRAHRAQLDAIVELLLERETLDEAEVYAAAGISRDTEPTPRPPDEVAANVRS